MTEQELKEYGYEPKECKIGTLYFKTPFAVQLKDEVATLYDFNEVEIGTATTIDELKHVEGNFYLQELNLKRIIGVMTYAHITANYPERIEEANRVFQTELNAFRKANQNWYETNFDPSIDREKIFLDEIINKYMHITTAFG